VQPLHITDRDASRPRRRAWCWERLRCGRFHGGLGVPADTPDGPGEITDYADRTWIVNSRNTTDDGTVRTQASVEKRTAPPEVAAPVPAPQELGRGRQRPPRRSHSEYSGQAHRENDDQPAHACAVRTEDVDERGKQPWRKE
jgi:hypothetical protein